MRLPHFSSIRRFVFGFLCSIVFSFFAREYTTNTVSQNQYPACRLHKHYPKYHTLAEETNAKDLVLVAVMTHMGTVTTRAVGISETWGKEIPGKLLFFVGESENKPEVDLPLITLPVGDNIYPPQKKAMLMLKYIYENYAEHFRWFIRADDDVYFRGDNLARLLRSINNNDDILLGHPGTGKQMEKGKLGLDKDTNFCIGGTGIIMSQSVLKNVYPNLEHCLSETVTSHEDSEVGRCLRKFVGVQCPWGFEANEYFHQEYGDPSKAYHGELELISNFEKVISLHPVKDVVYQYRLHVYYLGLKQRLVGNRAQKLKKNLIELEKLIVLTKKDTSMSISSTLHCRKDHCEEFHDKYSTHNRDIHPATWTLFHDSLKFSTDALPVEIIQGSEYRGLRQVREKAELSVIEELRSKLYHTLTFKDYVGYFSNHPIHGNLYEIQYSITAKVHRHGHLFKSFVLQKRTKFRETFTQIVSRVKKTIKTESELINIILPLSWSFGNFQNFMKNVEEMLAKFHEMLRIVVVFFRQVTSSKQFKSLYESYKKKFRRTNFLWLEVNGIFNASVALEAALKSLPNKKNNLLFFTQVQVLFDSGFLQRCRTITEEGKIYFPVSFRSRTDTKFIKEKFRDSENSSRRIRDDFVIFCSYSNDVIATHKWHAGKLGWREMPFVEQFLSLGDHVMEIFHAPDPGLVHSFDESARCLKHKQNKSCKDGFNSTRELFDYMIKKNYLTHYL